METETSKLLLTHFLRWQEVKGSRKTLKEFADLIGISDKQLNHYFTGRREPGERMAALFAEKLDDLRFYDAIGLARPDVDLQFVNRHWAGISRETQAEIIRMVKAQEQPLPDGKKIPAPHK